MAIVFITGSTEGLGRAAAQSLGCCTPDRRAAPRPSPNSRRVLQGLSSAI
jgi:hypothetical protein